LRQLRASFEQASRWRNTLKRYCSGSFNNRRRDVPLRGTQDQRMDCREHQPAGNAIKAAEIADQVDRRDAGCGR
jgi:hypothetical protein